MSELKLQKLDFVRKGMVITMQNLISASILSADFGCLRDELSRCEVSGCDMIHFDVMDGHFVPNISYGVPVLKSIKKYSRLPMDVHLMISEPYKYLSAFADAGADIITFHAEALSDPGETIDRIHELGLKAGISVKPNTSVDWIYKYLNKLDMVLIMTVEPGFGGQSYMADMEEKIKSAASIADNEYKHLDIQVDGGISLKTVSHAASCGANIFVAGSAVFNASDTNAVVSELRHLASDAYTKR